MSTQGESPEQIELLFAPIAAAVEEFAVRNALALDKCARGNSGWELTRAHGQGGEHRLLLMYDRTLGLGVGSVWWFPCEEMGQLYYHFRPMAACAIEPDEVVAALESESRELDKVRFGYWTHMRPLKKGAEGQAD